MIKPAQPHFQIGPALLRQVLGGVSPLLMFMGLLTGCGTHLTSGTATLPQDPTPTGTLQYQGQFSGSSSQTASGSALVYFSAGNFILHLASVSFPSESGLTVIVRSNLSTVGTFTLRASGGSQNYTFASSSARLASVSIHSPSKNQDYATAQLQTVIQSLIESFKPTLAHLNFPQNLLPLYTDPGSFR